MHSLGLQLTIIWWNFTDETEVRMTTVFFQKSQILLTSPKTFIHFFEHHYILYMLKSLFTLCLVV